MASKTSAKVPFMLLSKEELLALQDIPNKDVVRDGINFLRANFTPTLVNFVSLALLAYWKKSVPIDDKEVLKDLTERLVEDDSVKIKLQELLGNCFHEITVFADKWSSKELLSVIVRDFSWYAKNEGKRSGLLITPQPFAYLARELLRIGKGETVLDYCSGTAEFILNAYLHTEAAKYYGTEISTEAVIISKIRALFLGDVVSIRQGNSVTAEINADKVFADPPFAMKEDSSIEKWHPQEDDLALAYENIPRTRRMDWAFVLSALAKQKDGGRTVILTYDGLLFRSSKGEQEMRRRIVESGCLETVIALPQGILPMTNILCDLLVFSHGNTGVRMVDARDCRVKERFTSEMTQENMDEVLRRVSEVTDYSRTVSHEEIAGRDYALSPIDYMSSAQIQIENGVALGELLISLERGQLTPAAKLEKLSTKEETEFQYLMLKDIEDDAIRTPLPYLTDIPEAWDKYCVTAGSLVISRSAPIKIAIIPDLKGQKVLANGNMYFMKLDENRVNPIYVLCCLKSRDGIKQIEFLSKGSSITTLSIKELQKILIPMIPMEEQVRVAEKYTSLRRHLASLKRQERELEGKISSLIEEVN